MRRYSCVIKVNRNICMPTKTTRPGFQLFINDVIAFIRHRDNVSLSNQLICFFDDCTKFPSLLSFHYEYSYGSGYSKTLLPIIFPKQNVDVDHFYAADFFINNYQRLVSLSLPLLVFCGRLFAAIFLFFHLFYVFLRLSPASGLSGADFNYW